MSDDRTPTGAASSERLRRWGTTSWYVVGILVAASIIASAIAALSGLVVPLVFAAVVGTLGAPMVDRLARRGIPRSIGALALIVGLIVVISGAAVLTVRGIIDESDEIRATVVAGADAIDGWLEDRGVDPGDPDAAVDGASDQGRAILTGAAVWITTAFSSAMGFLIGGFLALFMLYYVLVDWTRVRQWLARHLGVPQGLGEAIVDDATTVVRRGFGAMTLTSLVTSSLIGLTMVALGLPLAVAVFLVTFITSYVPYLGAILSGAFGFLVALGAGDTRDAIILLVVIIVVQNIVQTIVGNRLTSDRLRLHPLPSLISSVCGVVVAGLVGAILSAPALALAIAVSRRVKQTRVDVEQAGAPGPLPS